MKQLFTILILFIFQPGFTQTANIPDAEFLNFLKANHPQVINASDQLIIDSAANVWSLNCSGAGISDLEGIQYFTGLYYLNASNNNLSSFPSINNTWGLRHLDISHNNLSSMPYLTLRNLVFLDVSHNALNSQMNLSELKELDTLYLQNNLLENAPDLSKLWRLDTVDVSMNFLSFEDLTTFEGNSSFSHIYNMSPQKTFEIFPEEEKVYYGENFYINAEIDQGVTETRYRWYKDGMLVQDSENHRLTVDNFTFSDTGSYYCEIINTDYDFKDVYLYTDTVRLSMDSCLDISGLHYSVEAMKCHDPGKIIIEPSSFNGSAVANYKLVGFLTGKEFNFGNSTTLDNLFEKKYNLVVISPFGCETVYPDVINIPNDCKDIYITPDNDGVNDTYYFTYTGKGEIFDSQGNLVGELDMPTDWDGTTEESGKLPPGYYMIKINEGDAHVMISVLY